MTTKQLHLLFISFEEFDFNFDNYQIVVREQKQVLALSKGGNESLTEMKQKEVL